MCRSALCWAPTNFLLESEIMLLLAFFTILRDAVLFLLHYNSAKSLTYFKMAAERALRLFLNLLLPFIFCMRCWAAAEISATPALPQQQNILLFQADITEECLGKCLLLVDEIVPSQNVGKLPPTASLKEGPASSPSPLTMNQSPVHLEAPLRLWNTLTLRADSHSHYAAKIVCATIKCQANLAARPLLLSTDSSGVHSQNASSDSGLSNASLLFTKMPSQGINSTSGSSNTSMAGDVFWIHRRKENNGGGNDDGNHTKDEEKSSDTFFCKV